jgi:hypothetical protein
MTYQHDHDEYAHELSLCAGKLCGATAFEEEQA